VSNVQIREEGEDTVDVDVADEFMFNQGLCLICTTIMAAVVFTIPLRAATRCRTTSDPFIKPGIPNFLSRSGIKH